MTLRTLCGIAKTGFHDQQDAIFADLRNTHNNKENEMMNSIILALALLASLALYAEDAIARIDVQSETVDLIPEKSTSGLVVRNPGWIKDITEKRRHVFAVAKKTYADWTEFEFSFVPQSDGKVRIYLMSKEASSKKSDVNIAWDRIRVQGATITNGDFETINQKTGLPQGWFTKDRNNYVKTGKNRYIKTGHDQKATQKITVSKGQKVTIIAMAKRIRP